MITMLQTYNQENKTRKVGNPASLGACQRAVEDTQAPWAAIIQDIADGATLPVMLQEALSNLLKLRNCYINKNLKTDCIIWHKNFEHY